MRMNERIGFAKDSLVACFLLLAGCTLVRAENWPTHLHDNQRTGVSTETMVLPLHLQWNRQLPHAPRPAWPDPARQDYWNRKTGLQPRVVYDRANGLVVADGRLVFGSSADDQIRCVDASTGELLWSFFTEGPVRLAPTIWDGIVVCGADDGYIYGLKLTTGQLLWKTRPAEIGTRRIPGNGRIISERPIRSNVLIEGGTGYVTAGLFPQQGAFFFSLDVRNGRVLDQTQLDVSPQGYLEFRDGRIFTPTGRDPHGAMLQEIAKRGDSLDKQLRKRAQRPDTYALIADQAHVFWGREHQVVAFADDSEQAAWEADVRGKPYAMAISNGALFVSTDEGWIYCFAAKAKKPREILPPEAAPFDVPGEIDRYLAGQPQRQGYALVIEPDRTELLLGLAMKTEMQVIAVVSAPDRADQMRRTIASHAYYGRVSVHTVASQDELPYRDYLFNLVIGGTRTQIWRLIRPGGGVAFCDDGVVKRPPLAGIGQWTHAYGNAANTSCSGDSIGGKMRLQWYGGPGPRHMVDRHMRTMPPLANNGRLFIPGLDRIMTVDAYNGTLLWEKSLPGSTRIGILKDCGWLVAGEDRLLVARGAACLELDAASGAQTSSFQVPVTERDWGYIAQVDGLILGSTTWPDASRRTIHRAAVFEGAYTDNRPIVCSDGLFGIDSTTAEVRWHYASHGALLNPTLAASRKAVFFVENDKIVLNDKNRGRVPLRDFLDQSAALVRLDLVDGKTSWRVPLPTPRGAQNMYGLCSDRDVILVNSRNDKTVHYDIRVLDAKTGEEKWSQSQNNKDRLAGDHGEQDKHPVLIGQRLIVEPYAYDLVTGELLAEINLGKRGYGCGTISASSRAIFFRSGNPASYQLDTHQIDLVTKVSRPGCWINMIPAAGLLLVPEGSSGCTCNFPLQCSMAFVPEGGPGGND